MSAATAAKARQMDRLADLMAGGCPSIMDAAYRMRTIPAEAERLWKRICRGLGDQAR